MLTNSSTLKLLFRPFSKRNSVAGGLRRRHHCLCSCCHNSIHSTFPNLRFDGGFLQITKQSCLQPQQKSCWWQLSSELPTSIATLGARIEQPAELNLHLVLLFLDVHCSVLKHSMSLVYLHLEYLHTGPCYAVAWFPKIVHKDMNWKMKLKLESAITTNDNYSLHPTLAACYQLAQFVLKVGSVLAESGDNTN